jgi:hypothetical protein
VEGDPVEVEAEFIVAEGDEFEAHLSKRRVTDIASSGQVEG